MGQVLENKFIQDLQLRVLQEFFKIQMEAAYPNTWITEVVRKAREKIANNNHAEKYRGIDDKVRRYGIENFNEKSMDVSALTAFLMFDFIGVCRVGSDFFNIVDNIRNDKNELVSHVSDLSNEYAVNALLYRSLENLSAFLTYLKNSNWNYYKKAEFANKYLQEIKELTGGNKKEAFEKKLSKLPFSELQQMVDDEIEIPEAELEMYLRMKCGYIKENEYDEEKKDNLLKKAANAGCAEAKARLALEILENPCTSKADAIKAVTLLDEAANNGSAFAHYVYGRNSELGLTCKPNKEQAYRHYCKGEESGCIEAAVQKAYCMAMGIGVEADVAVGVGRLNNLAKKHKSGYAYLYLGKFYYETEQYELAFKTFREGDNKTRDNRVAYRLAECYYYGEGTEQKKEDTACKIFARLARKGYVDGKEKLGECYYYARGIDREETEAFKLFTEADEKGNLEAKYMLGRCYFFGHGIDKDRAIAFKDYFTKAAELGHVGATYMQGVCYYEGVGTDKNPKAAFNCFKEAAEYEHIKAEYMLGKCYYDGCGTDKNVIEAFNCFKSAAENGNVAAKYMLGKCYYYGDGTDKNWDEAVKYFKQAADEGSIDAEYMLGCCYNDGNQGFSYSEGALPYFESAAQKGHIEAAWRLGMCYHYGKGTEIDLTKAFENFQRAAKLGNCEAQHWLGTYYLFGYGTKQNFIKAFDCFDKASKQGHYLAKSAIAHCYYYAVGCERDIRRALGMFEQMSKNAERKYPYAEYMLGCCYYYLGVNDQCYINAFDCFKRAVELKYSDANYMLGLCHYYGKGTIKDKKAAFNCFNTLSQKGVCKNYYHGWQLDDAPPSTNITNYIKFIKNVQTNLYAENEFMLGVFLHEGHQKSEALKHYKNAAAKGHEMARNMLEFLDIDEKGINDENIERLKEIGLLGIVGARRAVIAYLNREKRYEELEDLCIKNRWLNELTDQYIASIQPVFSFFVSRSSLLETYERAVAWLNKARDLGYKYADKRLLEAKKRYEDAKKTQETFN